MGRYNSFYVEECPVEILERVWCHEKHIFDGVQTGGMGKDTFLALKNDIKNNGLINPIIVELHSGNPPRFKVSLGNNRLEAWKQLGHSTIKAIICTKDNKKIEDYVNNSAIKHIQAEELENFMAKNHPGDTLWKKSVWAQRILKSIVGQN
jgi:lysozyme family protein